MDGCASSTEDNKMVIKELSFELVNDWLDFFENRAFEDHEEWRGCYCTAFYYPKPEEYTSQITEGRIMPNGLLKQEECADTWHT
jgi:hypothetical protein